MEVTGRQGGEKAAMIVTPRFNGSSLFELKPVVLLTKTRARARRGGHAPLASRVMPACLVVRVHFARYLISRPN